MKQKTILIVSSSHLCRNPRVVKEATTLGKAGYEVTVLNVATHKDFALLDHNLAQHLPFRRLVLDYTDCAWPARARSICLRARTWAARQALHWLRIESAAALGPARDLLRQALRHTADLTILHTEIPLWMAEKLVQAKRALAVDFEDWYSEDLLFDDRRTRPLRLLRRAERFALHNACYVSCPSRSMAGALAAAFDSPTPLVLRNVFPLQSRTRLDQPSKHPPAFVWFSQTIGPGRGLELFLAAWNRTSAPSRVVLIGGERPAYRDKLLRRLAPDRRSSLQFMPFVDPGQLQDKLTEFDIGLATEPHWPRNRELTISNKIFQYLNAGLAVVATDTTGQSEVLRAAPGSGLLVAAHETGLLAGHLDDLLSDASRLRTMQTAARRATEEQFCWERESPALLRAVEQALSRPSPAFT